MKNVQTAALVDGKLPASFAVNSLTCKVTAASIVKISSSQVAECAKWILSMGGEDFVTDFLDWHGMHVNPLEITFTTQWLDAQCMAIPKKYVLIKLNLLMLHVSHDEVVETRIRPSADIARFISGPDMTALGKQEDYLETIHSFMVGIREVFKPKLETLYSSTSRAMTAVRSCEQQVLLIALNKSQHTGFVSGVVNPLDKKKPQDFEMELAQRIGGGGPGHT